MPSTSVVVTSWDSLKFTWWEIGQSVENNTTTIRWKLELIATSDGAIYSTAQKSCIVKVAGVTYVGSKSIGIDNNSSKTLMIADTVINHNDDGTKTFEYSFSQTFDITFSGDWIGTVSGSGTGTLTTIAKASDFTVTAGTLGVAQNISITRQTTAFTHGLTYSCGGVKTQLICAWDTTAETVSFTPPVDLAWQAVNGNRVWVDIHLQTYYNANPIGSVITKGVWMTIPDTVKPSCNLTVSDPTGYATKFGAYVQGQSKLSIKVTPQASYGSAIAGYFIRADGATYSTPEVTTPVIRSTGQLEVYADVTDTRGRLGAASTTVTVLPYTTPVITTLKVHRCNQDGTENDRGSYCEVTYAYAIDTLGGKNGMSAFIQYKKTTETTYTSVALSNTFNVTNGTYVFAADDGSTYDVQLLIADSFASVGHRTTLSTAYTLIHYSPTGKGITFGGIRDGEGFNVVDMPFHINDIEVDYIVEQGEASGWFYRKWNGGFAECWKIYYGSVDSGKTNYSGFYYSETVTVDFPFVFTNLPTVTVDGGSVTYMNFVRVFGKYSDKASFTVVSMMDAGNVDVTVDIKAIGRWK